MSDILKIASAIICRVSTWLGCAKCFEDVLNEQVVHEETCNKTNDTENDEELVKINKSEAFILIRLNPENISNSIGTLLESLLENQQITEKLDNKEKLENNRKTPIKPTRKKLLSKANEHISTDNPTCKISQTNHK